MPPEIVGYDDRPRAFDPMIIDGGSDGSAVGLEASLSDPLPTFKV